MNEIKNYENENFRDRRYTRPNLRANHQGNLDSSNLRENWFRDGIFYFRLDRKIPKIRGSGSGYENLVKIPKKIPIGKSRKSRNPRDLGFF